MHKLSKSQTQEIISLLVSGHSYTAIQKKTGHRRATISHICADNCPDINKSSGGHPAKLTDANVAYAKHLMCMGKAKNPSQAAKTLQNITNQTICTKTLHHQLKKLGMKSVVKKKRPLLTARHRRARLEFAERHLEWTVDNWKRVWWSDETKINRFGSDGRTYVWIEAGEELSDRMVEGTVKFGGGNLMMWGCMSWEGIGFACRIEGKMDADLYVSILEDEFQQSLEFYGLEIEDIIFQQDNDPKHTSAKAKKWFQDHNVHVLKWPAQSPDLNPIEYLWHYLKRRLNEYDEPARGVQELWERVQELWDKIAKEECQKLIESMPNRVKAVYKAKGGYTKY